MSQNAVVPTGNQNTAVQTYNGAVDPFAVAALEEKVHRTAYMTFNGKEGGFAAGTEKDEVEIGTRFAAYVPEYQRGWICWKEGQNVDEVMIRPTEGSPPPESSLSDHGPYQKYDNGQTDGWQKQASVLLMSVDGGTVQYTFNTSSVGGIKALARLAEDYSKEYKIKLDDDNSSMVPIVELKQDSYKSKKFLGTIYSPIFEIVDWVPMGSLGVSLAGGQGGDYENEKEESGEDESQADEQTTATKAPPSRRNKF